jgi:hypothetical protein
MCCPFCPFSFFFFSPKKKERCHRSNFKIKYCRLMNAQIGEEVNRIILAPGKDSINTKVQTHIQDAFVHLEAGTILWGEEGERR